MDGYGQYSAGPRFPWGSMHGFGTDTTGMAPWETDASAPSEVDGVDASGVTVPTGEGIPSQTQVAEDIGNGHVIIPQMSHHYWNHLIGPPLASPTHHPDTISQPPRTLASPVNYTAQETSPLSPAPDAIIPLALPSQSFVPSAGAFSFGTLSDYSFEHMTPAAPARIGSSAGSSSGLKRKRSDGCLGNGLVDFHPRAKRPTQVDYNVVDGNPTKRKTLSPDEVLGAVDTLLANGSYAGLVQLEVDETSKGPSPWHIVSHYNDIKEFWIRKGIDIDFHPGAHCNFMGCDHKTKMTNRGQFLRHLVSHLNGVKGKIIGPHFVCPICPKKYFRFDLLINHFKTGGKCPGKESNEDLHHQIALLIRPKPGKNLYAEKKKLQGKLLFADLTAFPPAPAPAVTPDMALAVDVFPGFTLDPVASHYNHI